MEIRRPHPRKAIRFGGHWTNDGWTVKIYTISAHDSVDPRLIDIAKQIADGTLPRPAATDDRYAVACLTIHPSPMFNQIIVDWWERENELRHRVFKAEPESPYSFTEITETGEAFCIWELRVLAFEAEAWIDTILSGPRAPDLDRYLGRTLNMVL